MLTVRLAAFLALLLLAGCTFPTRDHPRPHRPDVVCLAIEVCPTLHRGRI